ncbi:ABC transporter ATP-binding protein [Sulfidibacter corallicola]|uniref:ABC transporter ATP-binding protein n=1 Tax=Sulfidibacter corallicola TaxID=2818388 RepID=A0A8A4TLQ8_SULCO|nr:ABC transporter ATP-binding protein [Sulfidibacter corallicola]QTD50144.1 ABC transporter ATP-binding protein [Sulfidibacter corallicola]
MSLKDRLFRTLDGGLHTVEHALSSIHQFFVSTTYAMRAIRLVWETSRKMTVSLLFLAITAGLLPLLQIVIAAKIVDQVLHAIATGQPEDFQLALVLVAAEGLALIAGQACEHIMLALREILRSLLSFRINKLILEKAQSLELAQFEDATFYDRLQQAREGASERPLSLIEKSFGMIRDGTGLIGMAVSLWFFSPWAVVVLVVASLPAFLVEANFANQAFHLFKWQSPELRMQQYLETVLSREDFVKEVKLFDLAGHFTKRYIAIFKKVFAKEKSLVVRREVWGFLFGILGIAALYGTYGWIVYVAAIGGITLGEMTKYIGFFREGQQAFFVTMEAIGGMYEDNLYITNLYEFLETPVPPCEGQALRGPKPADGLRFEKIWFTYPGADKPALKGVSFHVQPGEKLALVGENGSGKTTIVKLMTRLYQPESGRITLEGLDIRDWDEQALQRRFGVIFQDFVRYQLSVGENIGVGDVTALEARDRWTEAAEKGMATPIVAAMEQGYDTQLGRWFKNGRELSGGQWQKIALSRAFMRRDADILILDEPTAAMDAQTEVDIFDRFRELTREQMALIISHRFSTVRLADTIIVMEHGEILEQGDHTSLLHHDGRYASLFQLQAAGYQ